MKAVRVHAFGGPEVLLLEEVQDPSPGPGQVVVSVKAAGVNPVDSYIRAGMYGPRTFPFIPGADAAGIVQKVGSGVTRHKEGDRVYVAGSLSGTYAALTLCDEGRVHRLPSASSYSQGAALGVPAATAYRGLFQRGKAAAGETLLVHGASGGVGIVAVQLARAAGMTVIGTAGSPSGIELVKAQGAHHALHHGQPGYLKEILAVTSGKGVDIILEMLANVNLAADFTVLGKRGRIIVIGSRGKIEIDPRDTMSRDADIRGMSLFNISEPEYAEVHGGLIEALEKGVVRPVIDMELPLEKAVAAHDEIMQGGSHGKIVLLP